MALAPTRLAVLLTIALAGALGVMGSPGAGAATHPGLVPETPARGYPVILMTPAATGADRKQVYATDQTGRVIVAGGSFLSTLLPNGTTLSTPYFAAWDIDTKAMTCPGAFHFNNEVLAIRPGALAGTAYVAGRFTSITLADGTVVPRSKIALLDLVACTVDPTFKPSGGNGKLNNLTLVGSRLFVGGDFTTMGGYPVETVAELNAATAKINPVFTLTTAGELGNRVLGLGANDAGTRLVVAGRFGTMTGDGQTVPAPTAVIDISNPADPRLTPHRSNASSYPELKHLQDAAPSSDGATVALGFGTKNDSDYVYLVPTTEGSVTYRWRHFMRDSVFGVAVSNHAVYVAGHFCRPEAGPGATATMSPQLGLSTCTGSKSTFPTGAWRSHLAALSPVDGTPLTWNPGQGSWTGGRALTVTTRGLLVGFDGERTSTVRTGALAFFDFGPGVEGIAPAGAPAERASTAPVTARSSTAVAPTGAEPAHEPIAATAGPEPEPEAATAAPAAPEPAFPPAPGHDGAAVAQPPAPPEPVTAQARAP